MLKGSGVELATWAEIEEVALLTSKSATIAHQVPKTCFTEKASEIATLMRAELDAHGSLSSSPTQVKVLFAHPEIKERPFYAEAAHICKLALWMPIKAPFFN